MSTADRTDYIDTEVRYMERLNLSRNGNPRFKLTTPVGQFQTETDGSLNYGLESDLATDTPVRLFLTRAGKVWNFTLNPTPRND